MRARRAGEGIGSLLAALGIYALGGQTGTATAPTPAPAPSPTGPGISPPGAPTPPPASGNAPNRFTPGMYLQRDDMPGWWWYIKTANYSQPAAYNEVAGWTYNGICQYSVMGYAFSDVPESAFSQWRVMGAPGGGLPPIEQWLTAHWKTP